MVKGGIDRESRQFFIDVTGFQPEQAFPVLYYTSPPWSQQSARDSGTVNRNRTAAAPPGFRLLGRLET
jgi:hypothetical protein